MIWSSVAAAVMVLPGVALAARPPSYRPKPGAKCRPGYHRKVKHLTRHEHGKTVRNKRVLCVQSHAETKPPAPTRASTLTSAGALFETGLLPGQPTSYFDISAGLYQGSEQLVGLPLTYAITDATTGQTVATFAGTSNAFATCTMAYAVDDSAGTQTFTGEPVAPYQACALGTAALPAADDALLTASFAGDSTHAPSESSPAPL